LSSPTERTLDRLRKAGIECDKAEYWQTGFITNRIVATALAFCASHGSEYTRTALADACRMHGRGSPGVRKDLFGFIDIIAMRDKRIVAIQCTSDSNAAGRVSKIRSLPASATWLAAGGIIEVWAWKKVGFRWHERIIEVKEGEANATRTAAGHEAGNDAPREDPF